MVNLGVTWDQKFVPDITFFYIACITVSLVFVIHSYLLKSIKLFVFLYRSYIWMLVVISNFPFLIPFFSNPAPPIAKTKCDYFFLLVFPITSFPFFNRLTQALCWVWQKSCWCSLMQFVFVNTELSYWLDFKKILLTFQSKQCLILNWSNYNPKL